MQLNKLLAAIRVKLNTEDYVFVVMLVMILVWWVTTRFYGLLINFTHSLPEKLFIYKYDDMSFRRGDPIAIVAKGLPNLPDGVKLVKRVSGFPSDKVTIRGQDVYINDTLVTDHFDDVAYWGKLHKIESQVIPKNCYFVNGVSLHSFDSRYKEVGLICKERIVGRAWALF